MKIHGLKNKKMLSFCLHPFRPTMFSLEKVEDGQVYVQEHDLVRNCLKQSYPIHNWSKD